MCERKSIICCSFHRSVWYASFDLPGYFTREREKKINRICAKHKIKMTLNQCWFWYSFDHTSPDIITREREREKKRTVARRYIYTHTQTKTSRFIHSIH